MSVRSDFLIIGGGIAGLLTARELVTHGYATTLIEKQKVGNESSWAGGGILFPIYPWRQSESLFPLCQESLRIYPELAYELKHSTGIDPELCISGMLILDAPDQAALAWCEKHRVTASVLNLEDSDILPGDAWHESMPVLWLPDIAQIRNPKLITALRADLKSQGVVLFEESEALRFVVSHDRIECVETQNKSLCAAEIVIAAGAWSKMLASPFDPRPEIVPVKGQMLLYKTQPGYLSQIVLYQDHYLIPRLDGHILVGSTLEYTGYDKGVTRAARIQLDSFARRIFPTLAENALIGHWTGLRPGSPLGIPYIGRHPNIENLSFNCGHFRNGFAMGPASAALLADLLIGRTPRLNPEPYGFCKTRTI